jgi:dihydrodipicolinate synthase/N-acetylneuraminate lyase
MTEPRGVIPITATPFDADGRVDEDSIVTLLESEARCGVHGLNVLGMTGVSAPDILVKIYDLFMAGNVSSAAEMYDRYASYIRYEGQVGVGIALRKEVPRLRGAIRSSHVRPPGPALDDVTRAELRAILERAGILYAVCAAGRRGAGAPPAEAQL